MKYYFSADGTYLGGFDTGSESLVPTGSIEVQTPPTDGRDRLVNGSVVPYVAPVPIEQQLIGIYRSLSPDDQLTFAPLAATVLPFVQLGNLTVAKALIQVATQPGNAALTTAQAAIQAQMLAVFPA